MPGTQLARSAAFGSGAPLAMLPARPANAAGADVNCLAAAPSASGVPTEVVAAKSAEDTGSDCSTTDTVVGRVGSPDCGQPSSSMFSTFSPWAAEVSVAADAARPHLAPIVQPLPFRRVLRLEDALAEPDLGTAALPSRGSSGHQRGDCKPCAFMTTKGCASGIDCRFCHICGPGEKKRRQKVKRAMLGAVMEMQEMQQQQQCAGGNWSMHGVPQ